MAEKRAAAPQVFSSSVLASLILGSMAASICSLGARAEEGAPTNLNPVETNAAPDQAGPGPVADRNPNAAAQDAAPQDPAARDSAARDPAARDPAARDAAARDSAAPASRTAAAAAAVPKAAPKPVHVLTIAADESQLARLKALTRVMPGQPVRIIPVGRDPQAGSGADFAVRTVLQPGGDRTKVHEAKLFTEQLHIIAAAGIARVEDLGGRVVSFGAAGSAGQDAARKAFETLGVRVKETPLDLDNALDGAATGDVDAVVVLAPQPFDRLKGMTASGLHLLSWPEKAALPPGTLSATIMGDQYPGLAKAGETVRTVGVDAVLAVSAKGARQPATKRFLSAIAQHSAALSKRGFDLLKADLDGRTGRRVASNDGR